MILQLMQAKATKTASEISFISSQGLKGMLTGNEVLLPNKPPVPSNRYSSVSPREAILGIASLSRKAAEVLFVMRESGRLNPTIAPLLLRIDSDGNVFLKYAGPRSFHLFLLCNERRVL